MTLITTNDSLKAYCATLTDCPYITVDTEFMRERTYYAKLCLLQISGPDKEAVGVDVLAGEEELNLTPVWDLFANKKHLSMIFVKPKTINRASLPTGLIARSARNKLPMH
jgi:ribonuclease D